MPVLYEVQYISFVHVASFCVLSLIYTLLVTVFVYIFVFQVTNCKFLTNMQKWTSFGFSPLLK